MSTLPFLIFIIPCTFRFLESITGKVVLFIELCGVWLPFEMELLYDPLSCVIFVYGVHSGSKSLKKIFMNRNYGRP
jgi:hypothetical protein